MNTYAETKNITGENNYALNFWKHMRGTKHDQSVINEARNANSGGYMLPNATDSKYENSIAEKSVFGSIASVMSKFGGPTDVFAYDSTVTADFVPEYGDIDVQSLADDFTRHTVHNNKLATILKASVEFVTDAAFDIEDYLVKALSQAFAEAEDGAFVNGTGEDEPVGILDDTAGAETGVTADSITFDSVIDLFFSVDKKYRKKAVWLMNDKTALALRKLKDENGNYLWNHTNDTILGKPVYICSDMPDADAGEKPIAFGDFSYYWIIRRSPVFLRTLNEVYALSHQIGYLGYEFLDGMLIRRDAVKVLKVESEEV